MKNPKINKRNNSYWEQRSAARMELAHRNATKVTEVVNKAYNRAMQIIVGDMDNLFMSFSNAPNMNKSEAITLLNKRVSQKTINELYAKLQYIEDEEIRKETEKQITADAYRARMTRLQALKENIYIECKRVADIEKRASSKFYAKTIKDSYYRGIYDFCKGAGYQIDFAKIPTRQVNEILQANWSGKQYSRRIWDNSEVFASKLQEILLSKTLTGKHSRDVAINLKDYVKKVSDDANEQAKCAKFASERLLRTETTYMATMGDLAESEEMGIEKIKFIATLDKRTSPECRESDGKIILLKDAKPGVNVPPLHCFCRSTTINVFDDLEHKVRFARDEDGNPIKVPADMRYPEWKAKYAEVHDGKYEMI